METVDAVCLGVTIGLSIVSVGLGSFAIWLSMSFSQRSDSALSELKALSAELRAATELGLSQQEKFSSKMLDSILAGNVYGSGPDPSSADDFSLLEGVIKQQLEDAEQRISSNVEAHLRSLADRSVSESPVLAKAIEFVKSEARSLVEATAQALQNIPLPPGLRDVLTAMNHAPANYVLIRLILSEGVSTPEGVAQNTARYGLPEGWEGGIQRLLGDGILQGDPHKFEVTPGFRPPLILWELRNRSVLSALSQVMSETSKTGRVRAAREVAEGLQF